MNKIVSDHIDNCNHPLTTFRTVLLQGAPNASHFYCRVANLITSEQIEKPCYALMPSVSV